MKNRKELYPLSKVQSLTVEGKVDKTLDIYFADTAYFMKLL